MQLNPHLSKKTQLNLDHTFLRFSPESRNLLLRLLWKSPVDLKTLRRECGLSRSVVLNRLNKLEKKGLICRIPMSTTGKMFKPPCTFMPSFTSRSAPEITALLGLCRPPLTGIDLKGNRYMVVYRKYQKPLSKIFEWEYGVRGIFSWSSLVQTADFIGLPIKTCCQFLEYMGKIQDFTWDRAEMRYGLTSKKLREGMKTQSLSFITYTDDKL
jgi:hypothetical protein